MIHVSVVFSNGNVVNFDAQEFDATIETGSGIVQKYPYKDAAGQDSAIHVKPAEVAGIFLVPSPDHISVAVARRQ